MKVNYNTQKVFEALLNASENTNDWATYDSESLINETEINRRTLFRIMNKLESNGIIERQKVGKRSQYKILKSVTHQDVTDKSVTNQSVTNQSVTDKNVTNQNVTHQDVTHQDVTDKNVTDIIKDDNNMKTMESLQKENNRLNERLNNCAAKFKQLIATVNELKSKVTELETKLNDLSTKDEKITADDENEDEDDEDNSEKLDLSNDNTSSEVTNQDNQENALEAKETALNEIEEEYKLFTDAVKLHKSRIGTPSKNDLMNYKAYVIEDCENKKIKIDVKQELLKKIDIYISRYNNFDISTSIMADDTITPKEEEKPVEELKTVPEKKQYIVYKRKQMTEAEMDAETERALDSIFGTTLKNKTI